MDHAETRIRHERNRRLRDRLPDLWARLYLYRDNQKRHKNELARSGPGASRSSEAERRQRFVGLFARRSADLLDHALVVVAQENLSQSLGPGW